MALAMFLTADVVLAMVLIEDVLTFLMMIEECWYRNPNNWNNIALLAKKYKVIAIPKQQSCTALVIAAKRGLVIANMAMIAGQQAIRPAC